MKEVDPEPYAGARTDLRGDDRFRKRVEGSGSDFIMLTFSLELLVFLMCLVYIFICWYKKIFSSDIVDIIFHVPYFFFIPSHILTHIHSAGISTHLLVTVFFTPYTPHLFNALRHRSGSHPPPLALGPPPRRTVWWKWKHEHELEFITLRHERMQTSSNSGPKMKHEIGLDLRT